MWSRLGISCVALGHWRNREDILLGIYTEISYANIQKCRSEYAAAVKAGTGFFYGT